MGIRRGLMELTDGKHNAELFQAQAHVWHHMFNFVNSQSLKCAMELGIHDIIHKHGKPMTLSQLVAALPIQQSKAEGIYRLMRLMIQSGFFSLQKLREKDDHGEEEEEEEEEEEQEGYVLTNASQLLLKGHPLSMTPFFNGMLDQMLMKPFNNLSNWLQNEDLTPFYTAYGRTFWEYLVHEPKHSNAFNEAMASDARLVTSVLIDEGKKGLFDGLKSLVDVGGGTGNAAKAIAEAFPQLEYYTVFDLPHVVAGGQESGNLNFVGGDMFQSVPPADAVLLKWILHDWNDEECVKILKRCKEAIKDREGGKVIIIDIVMGDRKGDDDVLVETQLFNDMLMMMLTTGKERTEKEWSTLFKDASFSDYKITSSLGLRSIIELFP